MHDFSIKPKNIHQYKHQEIPSFLFNTDENIDWETVNSFGEEWSKFSSFSQQELQHIGDEYFDIVPKEVLNKGSYVLDMGCGTGRWTKYISDKVSFVEAVDPSHSVFAAADFLADKKNVRVSQATVDNLPFNDNSFDLVFSLGVLHHIPNTQAAMQKCVGKVKQGGYFLVYLYYSLDNRGFLFKSLFHLSNIVRRVVCKLPQKIKSFVCDLLAIFLYMPFVLFARLVSKTPLLFKLTSYIPLSYYRTKTFNVIRNDSLDRFGTPLEQRFSKKQIEEMMKKCGLDSIVFSKNEPYWHAIGRKNK